MADKKVNSTCAICGKPYYCCNGSIAAKSFTPWKKIVDSVEHYKIFMTLMSYTNKAISKEQAAKELSNCDLAGSDAFLDNIREAINEILGEAEPVKQPKSNKNAKQDQKADHEP